MMKKLVSLLVAIVLMTVCATAAFAAPQYVVVSETTQQFADGSSLTITVSKAVQPLGRATPRADGRKDYTYSSGGSTAWVFTVYGSFSVSASGATCTDAKYGFTGYQSAWRLVSASANRSGNTASASGTVSGPSTVYPSVSLSCDKNGNLY